MKTFKPAVGIWVWSAFIFGGWNATTLWAASVDVVNDISQTSYTSFLSGTNTLYAHAGDAKGMDGGTQHDLTRDYIDTTLASYGLATTLQSFTFTNSGTVYTGNNVVAVKLGTVNPNQIYVLGAHYDTINNMTGSPDPGSPGADDDASGVAGLLEAARVMSKYSFQSTIVFTAFDAEEEGLYGSAAYVQAHRTDNIKGMIELDMIAYNPTASGGYNKAFACGSDASNPIKDALISAVAAYSSSSTPLSAARDGSESSDHYSFEQAGFQATLLFEGDPSNPNYHQLTDSVDTPGYIDYGYATAMTRSAVGYLADSAIVVPEPGTLWLLSLGGFAPLLRRRKR